jgi:hypothetical protein
VGRAPLLLGGVIVAVFVLLPWSFSDKLFAIGYGLDPQRPSHTYFLGGAPLPLEARKVGMFGGFLVTYLGLLAAGRTRSAAFPPRRIMVALFAFIALMACDGLNATFYDLGWPHLYAPDLRLRLATGLLTGLAMACLLLPSLNGTLWRRMSPVPPLANARQLGGALLLCASLFVLVDVRLALLYYPIGVFGVAGLVTELTVINMIMALAVARRVGVAETVSDALPTIFLALSLTACELVFMSVVRYLTLGNATSLM